jgi:hypothetical protein
VNEPAESKVAAVVTPQASRLATAATFRTVASGRRWWLIIASALVVPKCVLCLLAYTGVAASLGWVGPELCGGTPPNHFAITLIGFAAVALATAAVGRWWRGRGFPPRPPLAGPSGHKASRR